jgi:TrmH family RNA methyltransferase
MEKIKEGIIVIGNESKGIQEELLDLSTHKITIPRIGQAESLNAAVAAGIILSFVALKK